MFEVGDRVIVTDNTQIIKEDPGYVMPMLKFAGKEAVIDGIVRDAKGAFVCKLRRPKFGDSWWFYEKSLLCLEDDDTPEIAEQDIFTLLSL